MNNLQENQNYQIELHKNSQLTTFEKGPTSRQVAITMAVARASQDWRFIWIFVHEYFY